MMGIEIHEEIVENLKSLDSFQLTEVLDFVRFLNYRQKEHIADTSIIDNLFGKYKHKLSSSTEFARLKEEEIKKEEKKWGVR